MSYARLKKITIKYIITNSCQDSQYNGQTTVYKINWKGQHEH